MSRSTHRVDVHNTHPRTRLRREPIARGVGLVLDRERVPAGEVRVILVSDEDLLQLNREHLGHDYFTDVITFPLEERPLEAEIYISVDRAREQAREAAVGLTDEVVRLAIHGALHLAGHDDATTAMREAMSALEDRYLAQLGKSPSS